MYITITYYIIKCAHSNEKRLTPGPLRRTTHLFQINWINNNILVPLFTVIYFIVILTVISLYRCIVELYSDRHKNTIPNNFVCKLFFPHKPYWDPAPVVHHQSYILHSHAVQKVSPPNCVRVLNPSPTTDCVSVVCVCCVKSLSLTNLLMTSHTSHSYANMSFDCVTVFVNTGTPPPTTAYAGGCQSARTCALFAEQLCCTCWDH